MTGGGRWSVGELAGTPAELHTLLDPTGRRRLLLCRPQSAAVVIGSAQAAASIDADRAGAAGLEVVRRRTGGGAVLV
ncbi:MAG TPA: hypothetical protein VFH45_03925, partial [Acidimicrobiales bacterium]|nr:hypothetical protein [Acidimicrobiales bacterium]